MSAKMLRIKAVDPKYGEKRASTALSRGARCSHVPGSNSSLEMRIRAAVLAGIRHYSRAGPEDPPIGADIEYELW